MSSTVIAIHEPASRINHLNMDGTELGARSPSTENITEKILDSTRQQGVPIITNPNLYTVFNDTNTKYNNCNVPLNSEPSLIKCSNLETLNPHFSIQKRPTNRLQATPTINGQLVPIIQRRINPDSHNLLPRSCREFQQIIYKYGRKFYGFLVPKENQPNRICLIRSNDYQDGDFVIAMSHFHPGYDNPKPIFTSFRSYVEAYNWLNTLTLEQKVGFEVILPNKQKPRFDADIKFDDKPDDNKGKFTIEQLGSDMMIALPIAINDVMIEYHVNYNRNQHLLISNSSTPDKQSYHGVIRGFCHKDNIEAKAFYELVKDKLPSHLQRYLDNAVYGSKQQFRLLGNHKVNKTNVKVFDEILTFWRPKDDGRGDSLEIKNLQIFEEFLVTYTSGCIDLPSFINKSSNNRIKKTSIDSSLYENQIIALYESSTFKDSGSIRDFNGNTININNSGRFECPICNKIHEHENPYLYVYNGSLYWDCRRHDKNQKSMYIGRINGVIQNTVVSSVGSVLKALNNALRPSGCCFIGDYCMEHHKNCPQPNDSIDNKNEVIDSSQVVPNTTSAAPKSSFSDNSGACELKIFQGPIFTHDSIKILPRDNCQTINGTNKLDEILVQNTQRRVQAHAIIGGAISPQNNLINPSQVDPNINDPVGAVGKLSSNDNSPDRMSRKSLTPANKDTLVYFVSYHITIDFKAKISLNDFVNTYKNYCIINSLKYQYKSGDTIAISRDLALINPKMKTQRKEIKGVKSQFIVGYKFHMLDFMNVRLDQQLNRTLDVTNVQPMVLAPEIKAQTNHERRLEMQRISAENKAAEAITELTRKDWYDRIVPERLPGTHAIDMRERLATMEELVGNRNEYQLFLKAPCGIGKTELIRDVLRSAKKYIIVVGRIMLGRKIENDMMLYVTRTNRDGTTTNEWVSECKFYSDLDGEVIRVNKVIVTIDSLYRVEGYFDYMILDEASYTLNQLVNFSKLKSRNADALIERIKRTPKIIIADAFLKQTTVDALTRIRGRNDAIVYENHYPKQNNKEISEIASPGIYYSMIEYDIGARTKILIPSGSAITAEAIAKNMVAMGCKLYREDEVPEPGETAYKVKIYVGEDRKFGDPTVEWSLFDCIIYTSVLEAGNSFVDLHFSKVYGFFTADSFGPESALQMIFRSRQLITGKVYVLVMEGHINNYPASIETIEDIKRDIRYDNQNARDEMREGIRLSYIDGIDYTHEYFDIFADVKYREVMGKRNYSDNLMKLCKSQGMTYGIYINDEVYKQMTGLEDSDADSDDEPDEDTYSGRLTAVCARIKAAKSSNRRDKCNGITSSLPLQDEDAKTLSKSGNLSKNERYSLIKFDISKRYGFRDPPNIRPLEEKYTKEPYTLTADFVHRVLDNKKSHTNVTWCKTLSGTISEDELTIRKITIAEEAKIIERPKVSKEECLNTVLEKDQCIEQYQADLLVRQNQPDEKKKYPINDNKTDQSEMDKRRDRRDEMTNIIKGVVQVNDETPTNDVLFSNPVSPTLTQLMETEQLYEYSNRKNKIHIADRLKAPDKLKRYKMNIHAVNILRIYGFNNWLRTEEDSNNKLAYPIISKENFKERSVELLTYVKDPKNVCDFVNIPEDIITGSVGVYDGVIPESSCASNDNKIILDRIRSYVNDILDTQFKMKLLCHGKIGYYLRSFWQLDNDGYVRPLTYHSSKMSAILTVPSNSLNHEPGQGAMINKKLKLQLPSPILLPKGAQRLTLVPPVNGPNTRVKVIPAGLFSTRNLITIPKGAQRLTLVPPVNGPNVTIKSKGVLLPLFK